MNYIEETKEKWEEIQKITDREEREEMREKFEQKVLSRRDYWYRVAQDLRMLIEERNVFVTSESLYPRDYASMITTLEVHLESVEEYIAQNPLKIENKIELLIEEEKGKVQKFIKLKKNVLDLMPLLEKHAQELDENEKLNFLIKKQELFLCFQNGNVNKATSLVNRFKEMI